MESSVNDAFGGDYLGSAWEQSGADENDFYPSGDTIRDSIAEKVNSILWLDKLVEEEKAYEERLKQSRSSSEKCMVCTLPHGTCEHTRAWIQHSYEQRTRIPDDENLEQTINDMLSVIGDFKLDSKPVLEDIDLDQMQWKTLEQRPTDKIGSTNVCLFSPDERGWHSTIKLSAILVLVFGGLKYRTNQVPPLFTTEPHEDEVEFLNDIRAYDTQNLAWYGVRARGKKNGERDLLYPGQAHDDDASPEEDGTYEMPEGRYGHIAAALDENRMVIFGGRGAGGRNLRDTWIYHYDSDRWEQVRVNEALQLPVPKARYFSAAVSVPIPPLGQTRVTSSITCQLKETDRDVYMFGGTSGTDYFGDLWVFRGSASLLRWEPLLAVGIPPSPRFAHQMVVLYDEHGVEANHYQNGGQQLMVLGGCTFRPQADMVGRNLVPAELSHQVHTIAGSMQTTKKAKLAQAYLDVYVLSITELIWRSMAYPGVKGTLPSARMHFSAACISRHVFVFGGLEASALRYRAAEHDGQTAVYVLDMSTMQWRVATAINSHDHLKEPIRIAQADVIRAIRRCDEEKLRGLSLGALNGKTIELAEAQCVLEVCRWRQSVLLAEQEEHTDAPAARWGATLVPHGQRMIYIGGWETNRAVLKGKSAVLNVEQEHERRRRLDDEYSAKLHRDRIRDQAEANMANVQSIYELRAIRQAELDAQLREQRQMTFEELLSSLPPLSHPESVKLVKANRHTIWVQWPRLLRNSRRQLVDADSITYFLYVRVGFENLGKCDRVFATVPPSVGGVAPARPRHSRQQKHNAHDAEDVFFNDDCKRFPAEITRACGDGKFDLLFDDGTIEKAVPRHRLKRAPPLNLAAVLPSLLSRPNTANGENSSSRPGTAGSAGSADSDRDRKNTSRGVNTARSGRSRSPSRAQRASPERQRTATESPRRPGTASAEAALRTSISAALLTASAEAAAVEGPAAASVVPLEFAATMRNRIQQQQRQKDRALNKIDRVFRGVKQLTQDEVAELERQSRRDRRQRLRDAEKERLRSAGLTGPLTGTSIGSPLSTTRGFSPRKTFSNSFSDLTVNFGDATTVDELFSYGEAVSPGAMVAFTEPGDSAEPDADAAPSMTVQVDPRWKLVYVGNDTEYSCTHLVPEDALEREPGLRVPVAFCYQVLGADEPSYERSQLSTPVIFFTQSAQQHSASLRKAAANAPPQKNRMMRTSTLAEGADSSGSGPPPGAAISKTKKEIIMAVVAGQQMVQIEKWNNATQGYGISEAYL